MKRFSSLCVTTFLLSCIGITQAFTSFPVNLDPHRKDCNSMLLAMSRYKRDIAPTSEHAELQQSLQNQSVPIVLITGKAGTGKTYTALREGLYAIHDKKYRKLVVTRPYVGASHEMGFLKGTLEEKMQPYIQPLLLYIDEWQKETGYRIAPSQIEIVPLTFMRGRTFKHSFILADEMSNANKKEILMLLTRIGQDSKLVLTGDYTQSDLRPHEQGWTDFLKRFFRYQEKGFLQSISHHRLSEQCVLRHPIIQELLQMYPEMDQTF